MAVRRNDQGDMEGVDTLMWVDLLSAESTDIRERDPSQSGEKQELRRPWGGNKVQQLGTEKAIR